MLKERLALDLKTGEVFLGVFPLSKGGSSYDVTDIQYDYAVLREQYYTYYATNSILPPFFNKDRSKAINAWTSYPSGSGIRTYQYNTANLSGTVISNLTYEVGQSTSGDNNFQSKCAISEDDTFVVVRGLNNSTGFHRIGINSDYTISGAVSIDLGVNVSIPTIINANTYAAYNGQNLFIVKWNGTALSLYKTIALDFTPISISSSNGFIILASSNAIKVLDVEGNITYSEDTQDVLASVISKSGYVFLKTSSSQTNPLQVYSMGSGGVLTSIPLSINVSIPTGSVISLMNIVKDDNVSEEQYILAFHTSNSSFIGLSVNITKSQVSSLFSGSETIGGTPQTNQPQFLSGNRVSYNGYYSGQPGTGTLQVFMYEFTTYSLKYKGKLFKIVGLG